MRTFIVFLFTFTLITHVNAKEFASKITEWKIISGDNHYYIQKLDSKTKIFKILSVGGEPRVDKIIWKKESPGIIYVIYQAGSAGTSHIVKAYRAVIYDLKNNKFLGDVAYRYISENNKEIYRPTWIFHKGKLSIEDESYNTKVTIPLK